MIWYYAESWYVSSHYSCLFSFWYSQTMNWCSTDTTIIFLRKTKLIMLIMLCKFYLGVTCNTTAQSDTYGRILSILFSKVAWRGGTLPTSIGNFQVLSTLTFDTSDIGGIIPSTIGQLISPQTLRLNGNLLIESIPTLFDNLLSLTELRLSLISLIGPIPDTTGLQ